MPHRTSQNRLKVADFIQKLYEILEEKGNGSVIVWTHGGFAIRDSEALVRDILPLYYRHSKLQSFIRQLNLYGFKRVTKTSDKQFILFENDLFRQGDRISLHAIQLKSKRNTHNPAHTGGQRGGNQPNLREITQQRTKEFEIMRLAFKSVVQTIYSQIISADQEQNNLPENLKQGLSLLRMCGVNQEISLAPQSPKSPRSLHSFKSDRFHEPPNCPQSPTLSDSLSHSLSHSLTKFNLQL